MWTHEFEVETGHRPVAVDLTERVNAALASQGDGLVNVFLPHATAGLALIELGSGSDADLLDRLDNLLPREQAYRHRHGARGHGRDHLLPALVAPSLVLPVQHGLIEWIR